MERLGELAGEAVDYALVQQRPAGIFANVRRPRWSSSVPSEQSLRVGAEEMDKRTSMRDTKRYTYKSILVNIYIKSILL